MLKMKVNHYLLDTLLIIREKNIGMNTFHHKKIHIIKI